MKILRNRDGKRLREADPTYRENHLFLFTGALLTSTFGFPAFEQLPPLVPAHMLPNLLILQWFYLY